MRDESWISERPQVSIIVPVHDEGALLMEAIDSLLRQMGETLPSFEIIVVDDASTDPVTLKLLEELRDRDRRITVLENSRSKGVSGARNTGITASTGCWLAFLDADDLWLQCGLAERWKAIQAYPDAKWLAARHVSWRPGTDLDSRQLREDSPILYSHVGEDFDAGRVSCLRRPVRLFLADCPVQTGTVMCRRDLAIEQGMFDESLARAEDYLLWLKFASNQDLYYVPKTVAVYRLRPGSLTRSGHPIGYGMHAVLEKLSEDGRFVPYRDEIRQRLGHALNGYCFFYRQMRQRSAAIRWSLRLLAHDPLCLQGWKHLIAATVGR
jgi:glycosyltransferase involved in cell wall biosynthesis